MSDKNAEAPKPAEGAAPPSGGIKAMLPLILNVVLMPVMAYVMTVFVLLPKINGTAIHAEAKSEGGGHGETAAAGEHGEKPKEGHGEISSKGGHGGKEKTSVPLSTKVLVNVSGTAGTRYLLVNITLVGNNAQLKEQVEKADAQLRDVASSVLAVKTIADIDKPGARNLIRTELVSAFNSVLGDGTVKEIYFTEFAIQ